MSTRSSKTVVIERADLDGLLSVLKRQGYRTIGPTVRDRAVVYEEIRSLEDLPIGWTDEQDGGSYKLKRGTSPSLFSYVVGPQSWKKELFPPELRLWAATRDKRSGFSIAPEKIDAPKLAFLGVRACELAAIGIQDVVFQGGEYRDPTYTARREKLLIIAVNCMRSAATCFCASMGTGPKAEQGFDLALTEIIEEKRHYFVVDIGSDRGYGLIAKIPNRPAREAEYSAAQKGVARTASQMKRSVDRQGMKELLYRSIDHPRWEAIAERCLSCANCTMVCPTCFCSTVEDVTDLTGEHAERWRKWDSCFTVDFSYIHGGSIRRSVASRYRQWMTHKLATWIDQFGSAGCVGCGRCITWCPVGIDITEELRVIQESERAASAASRKDG